MALNYVLDSNFVFDLIDRHEQYAMDWYADRDPSKMVIPLVVVLEGFEGARDKKHRRKLRKWFEKHATAILSLPGQQLAKRILYRLCLKTGMESNDALIAATALELQLPLVTRNQKDFREVDGLSLIDPS